MDVLDMHIKYLMSLSFLKPFQLFATNFPISVLGKYLEIGPIAL